MKRKNHQKTPKPPRRNNLKDLRIADLELLISAAHLKSLGKAAALHHLSQSAASAAIQRVESAFGMLLCTHEKRRFGLTPQGMDLLPRAESWVKSLHATVAKQEELPLRIATTHAIARACIPPILSLSSIDLRLMRPDQAYGAVLRDEADIAIVLDNAPWEGVIGAEIGKGMFQIFSRNPDEPLKPLLMPENQIEVLTLEQRWQQIYEQPLQVKARLPSWSLIADICAASTEAGFLPDFLGKLMGLSPMSWQPLPSRYRVLALYRHTQPNFEKQVAPLLKEWRRVFQ